MNRRQFHLTACARAIAVAAGVAAASAGSMYAPAALADTWPSKPVTVIVPFPAGGGTDAIARPLTAQLSKQLGHVSARAAGAYIDPADAAATPATTANARAHAVRWN